MNIREFERGDTLKLSHLLADCFQALHSKGYIESKMETKLSRRQMERFSETDKNAVSFVATMNNSVIGTCGYSDGMLHPLFIDISLVGRGIGRALVTQVVEHARKRANQPLETWSTVFTENFFMSFGFQTKREIYLPNGFQNLYLRKMMLK